MVMDISSRREEPIGFIDLLAANKIENYQRLYDAYIKRGGALANIGHHSSGSYMDNRRREIQFFADRGVVITQEAFQDIASLDAYQKLRNLRNILDSLPLWKEEYPLFVTDDMIQCIVDNNTADNALDQYEYDTSSRSHDTLKFLELWKALHREYNVLYTTTYYQLVYKNFNTESIQASILENDDSNKTV